MVLGPSLPPALFLAGRKQPLPHGSRDSAGTATYSLISRVMMMRMGLLFIPPTQLLLHMKLYRMVVNSVPTCPGEGSGH